MTRHKGGGDKSELASLTLLTLHTYTDINNPYDFEDEPFLNHQQTQWTRSDSMELSKQ